MLYEVTIRTLGGHFWLRPDPACRAIVDGVFGKALALYQAVRLYAYDAQSNHLHYLCSADDDPDQLPLFIDYVHGNIARQLNDLRDREGVFWSPAIRWAATRSPIRWAATRSRGAIRWAATRSRGWRLRSDGLRLGRGVAGDRATRSRASPPSWAPSWLTMPTRPTRS
ncbi:MAG: hypothetical protein IPH44_36095 [Myxococcales bacterium]|nr:hypothetical protein [Myxococcales bacterium]